MHSTDDEDNKSTSRVLSARNSNPTQTCSSSTTLSTHYTRAEAHASTSTSFKGTQNDSSTTGPTCSCCKEIGHYARQCPHKQSSNDGKTPGIGKTLFRTVQVTNREDPSVPVINNRQASQFETSPGAVPAKTVTTQSGRRATQPILK